MDWEEYLANLESADEQNYKRLFGEEYIKKSDVKTIISRIENINIAVDSWEQIEELPTINFSGIIDEMIEDNKTASDYMCDKLAWPVRNSLLQELKQRLLNDKPYPWRLVTPSWVIN